MKKNIAILFGGDSAEKIISEKSGKVVYSNINTEKYNPFLVRINENGWFVLIDGEEFVIDKNDFSFINDSKIIFDKVFIAIHGTPGENGLLQAYFDLINIPYVASGAYESAVTFNKWATTTVLSKLGINVAKSILLNKGDEVKADQISKELDFPCFIKPNQAGSSFGVTKANSLEDIYKGVKNVWEHDDQVLIESFLEGTEVTCGVYKGRNGIDTLDITELVSENEFFDFDAKYKGESNEITPARITEELREEIFSISKKIYEKMNLSGVSRVDFMIVNNVPFVIEVNTIPGMSELSIVPQQAKVKGYELKDFFTELIEQV